MLRDGSLPLTQGYVLQLSGDVVSVLEVSGELKDLFGRIDSVGENERERRAAVGVVKGGLEVEGGRFDKLFAHVLLHKLLHGLNCLLGTEAANQQ